VRDLDDPKSVTIFAGCSSRSTQVWTDCVVPYVTQGTRIHNNRGGAQKGAGLFVEKKVEGAEFDLKNKP